METGMPEHSWTAVLPGLRLGVIRWPDSCFRTAWRAVRLLPAGSMTRAAGRCPGHKARFPGDPLNVRFLDVGVGLLAPLQQRVPAKRRDDPHGRDAIVATIRALMVCSLFSAWSKTMEAGDSKTSSVTSSASRPRLP